MRADAEQARAVLAYPHEVELVVDGVVLDVADAPYGVRDAMGTATFVCPPGGRLADAGLRGARMTMTMVGGAAGDARLSIVGRLRVSGTDECTCCDETRDIVVLDADRVLLEHDGERVEIAPKVFADPGLELNAGFLRRSEDHLNRCHAEELRAVVARAAGVPIEEIIAVQLSGLDAAGVELQWVTGEGADRGLVRFPRISRSAAELGAQLRGSLDPNLC